MVCNGYIVQDMRSPWICLPNTKDCIYSGLCAYMDFPLLQFSSDTYCQLLSNAQSWRKADDNLWILTHFISDERFLKEYLQECLRKNIVARVLRVESCGYYREICSSFNNSGKLLGYEVCSLPLDDQIIGDLMYNPACVPWKAQLNEFGLFNSADGAKEFFCAYKELLGKGLVGDGEENIYVFAVFEVDVLDCLKG